MENFQIYDARMEAKSKAKGRIQLEETDRIKGALTSQTCDESFAIKKTTKGENDPLLSRDDIVDSKKTMKCEYDPFPISAERKDTAFCEKAVTKDTCSDEKCLEGCKRENCCVRGLSTQNPDPPEILRSPGNEESSSFFEIFDCIVKCPRCGHETDTEEKMEKHWLKKHGKVGSRCKLDPYPLHKCNICGFETKVKRNLPTHSCVAVKCGLCDFESRSKQLLNQHKITSHKTKIGLVFCNICPYKSNRITNVENHKKTVHEGVRIVCQHCAKRFTQQSDFRRHLVTTHNEVFPAQKERRYPICDPCGYKTRLLSTFDKHKCDPIKCEKCDFETKNEVHMRRHKIRLHLKRDGMFCCDKCPFKSARNDNLKKHTENKHKH